VVTEANGSTEVYVWDGTEAVNVSDSPGEDYRAASSWGGAG
jgi:hypothetical protein